MLIVTYDLNNNSGLDLILPEIRRHKTVRLGPSTYALVSAEDLYKIERQLHDKILPGDKVWILTAEGPYRALEFELPSIASVIH